MNISGTSSSSTTDYSRITGLATGLDTDGMVKQAIAGDQEKIDQVKQVQQYLEWQQEAYVEVIKDLKEFQNNYLDILGPEDKSMMKASSYNGTKAVGEFDDYLDITTYPGAIKGNYEVTVIQLATGAKEFGTINSVDSLVIPAISATDWNDNSKNITFKIPNSKIVDGKVVSNGTGETGDAIVSISLSTLTGDDSLTGTPTPAQVIKAFQTVIDNSPLKGMLTVSENEDHSMKFTSVSDKNINILSSAYDTFSSVIGTTLTNNTSTKLSELTNTQGSVKITVDGKDFTIDATDTNMTIDGFINNIRNAIRVTGTVTETLSSFINVTYSELTKKITIENKSTGITSTLKIEDVSGNVAQKLGLITNGINTGQNSKIDIKAPGEISAITVEKNSNNFTIDNIKFNLTKADSTKVLNVNIKADATDSVAKIKKFIEAYNSLIEKLNTKISEKKNYNYKPLTDSQKKEMNEDEIKKWEEQAKKGILARESNISNLLLKVREAFYSTVEGAGISLSDIGISTMQWSSSKIGKLEVNEDVLKSALESRGDQINKLFTQSGSTDNTKGILQKIKDVFKSNIEGDGILLQKAGYENSRWLSTNQLSKSIEAKKKQIYDMQQRMYNKQERYYKMFAVLERNMNNLNSQSSWLATQLGSV